jgi:hypothetical protein
MSYENDFQITAPAKAMASRIFGVLAISLASAGIAHAAPGMTREQVQEQLIAAERTGDIVEPWTQEKLNELYPSEYRGKAVANESSSNKLTQASEAAAGADDLSQAIALKNEYGEKAGPASAATASTGQQSQTAD